MPMPQKIENPQYELLYRELEGPIVRYFRRFPGLRGMAEDLTQEVFLRAYKGRERLGRSISPRAFVFGIARHVGVDALRRLRSLETLEDDVAEECANRPVDTRLETVRAEICRLPEAMREALSLKIDYELSYAEIAEVLDVPLGTVRSRLHNAVLRLRSALCDPKNERTVQLYE